MTGSLNQHGDVQAIGGVNEKIEGFFDICKARGLTGTQGVLIPESNNTHLMLRADVRDAVAGGNFHVYTANTIDEALEVLVGATVQSIDARVSARIEQWYQLARRFSAESRDKAADDSDD